MIGPRVYEPVAIMRQFSFVRETLGANRGVFVEAFQRIGDGKPGDSWCMDLVSFVLWVCYQGPAPLPRTGACAVAFEVAKQNGWITKNPAVNDVFFRVDETGHAHHVGLVTRVYSDRVGSIAGNTSEDGLSSNGTGVFEHDLSFKPSLVFVHIPDDSHPQLVAA